MNDNLVVTDSCGCLYCDLDLPIVYRDGRPTHEAHDGMDVRCRVSAVVIPFAPKAARET
jgi:hypothetical protein